MGSLFVVGIGPGHNAGLTREAEAALGRADVIAGYMKYVELVRPYYPDKDYLATGMTRETERCKAALEAAASGRTAALVCSGDAGIYGMSGLVYELSPGYPGVEIKVVPGVTAASSGSALLGAPLTHDFAVVSLSDLLTPWETIEKRLRCAAAGDFCLCIYNPSSRGRPDYLKRACDILLESLPAERVCGVAANIGRGGESALVTTLGELRNLETDMFATVFVGNTATKVIGGKIVTPRGYRDV
jgi:precorrin-3B C17-methyltransferase